MEINEKGRRLPTKGGKTAHSVGLADKVQLTEYHQADQATLWPTPLACKADQQSAEITQKLLSTRDRVQGTLMERVVIRDPNYPTPTKTDAKCRDYYRQQNGNDTLSLSGAAKLPTPKTNGFCGGSGSKEMIDNNDGLSPEEKRSMLAGNGGQLNPDWVEWLMGWPIGWSSKKPIAEPLWITWDIDPADLLTYDDLYIPRLTKKSKERVPRLRAIGNGQVPQCVVLALEILEEMK